MTSSDRLERYPPGMPEMLVNSDGIMPLARRERQIVRAVAEGLTNREIARQLGISVHTVRNTLATVFIKTGAQNRVVLTGLFLKGRIPDSKP